MPYIYSNRGLGVRWEDEPYAIQPGEQASDIYPDPEIVPSILTTTTSAPTADPLEGLRDMLVDHSNRIAALEAREGR